MLRAVNFYEIYAYNNRMQRSDTATVCNYLNSIAIFTKRRPSNKFAWPIAKAKFSYKSQSQPVVSRIQLIHKK